MSTEWIAALKVVELKEQLKQRGLPVNGLKADLAARLTEAVEAEQQGDAKEPSPAAADEAPQQQQQQQEEEQAAAPAAADPEPEPEQQQQQVEMPQEAAAVVGKEPAAAAPAEQHAEEVLDFEGSPAPEEEQPPAAAPASPQQQQQQPAASKSAVKRPATAAEAEQAQQPAAQDGEQQPAAKRARRSAIPAPAAAAAAVAADGGADVPAGAADAAADGGSERKRKHAPITFAPPARGSSRELTHQGSTVSAEAGGAPPAAAAPLSQDQAEAVARAVEEAGEVSDDATAALCIKGLRRPFTQTALTQKLSESGVVEGVWLTKIKDKAWVTFAEASHAHATRSRLQGAEWPAGNKNTLAVDFVAVELAKEVISNEAEPQAAPPAVARTSSGAGRQGSGLAERAIAAATGGAPAAAAAAGGDRPSVLDRLGPRPMSADDADAAPEPAGAAAEEPAVLSLDDLFRKTAAKPPLYYLPLTDDQVAAKRAKREAAARAGSGGKAAVARDEAVGPAVQEGLAPVGGH